MRSWLQQLREVARSFQRLDRRLHIPRGLLTAVVGTSLLTTTFEGIGVGLLVPLLSLLLGGEQATPMRPIQFIERNLPGHSAGFYVAVCCVAIIVTIGAKNVASYLSQACAARLKRTVSIGLRDALFAHLQRADLDLFERRPGGEIANIFLVETYRASLAIDGAAGFIQRTSFAMLYVLALFYISWPLTILVVVLAASLGGSIAFVYRRLTSAGTQLTELNHRVSASVEQSFSGIRIVRASNAQEQEIRRFHDLNAAQAAADESSSRAAAMLFPITETLAVIGAMLIVVFAYVILVRPGYMLSSYLLSYGFVLLRLLPLLNQLYAMQGNLFYLSGGMQEVEKWLATRVFPARAFGARPFTGIQKSIRFEQVGFTYETGTVALDDVSFEIPAGETVALVGPSGSGKSTIVALLLRLRAPGRGRILVDDDDYWDIAPAEWHRAIATVDQDAFLFHGTLRDNILYARENATAAELRRAVVTSNLEDVVEGLPNGLDTLVGERGAMLSGGQRQRVAIARAVVRDPAILILDEATSHLDTVSEQVVQRALINAARGRTTLVIAHRLSTVREADRIVVLERGRIVEQGTWEVLQASGGAFTRLLQGMTLR